MQGTFLTTPKNRIRILLSLQRELLRKARDPVDTRFEANFRTALTAASGTPACGARLCYSRRLDGPEFKPPKARKALAAGMVQFETRWACNAAAFIT